MDSGQTAVGFFEPFGPTGNAFAPATAQRRRHWGLRFGFGLMLSLALIGASMTRSLWPTETARGPLAAPTSHSTLSAQARPPILASGPFDPDRALSRLSATIDAGSGELQEFYGLGRFGDDQAVLRLDVRARQKPPSSASLFVVTAEAAAEAGAIVERIGASTRAPTARDQVEWAPATLSAAGKDRSCLAFRLATTPDKRLSGFLCAADFGASDEAMVACLVDRLELTAQGQVDGFDAALSGPPVVRATCRGPTS